MDAATERNLNAKLAAARGAVTEARRTGDIKKVEGAQAAFARVRAEAESVRLQAHRDAKAKRDQQQAKVPAPKQ